MCIYVCICVYKPFYYGDVNISSYLVAFLFQNPFLTTLFTHYQAIDFLLDRFETMTNVTSDMFVARMLQVLIQSQCYSPFFLCL